MMSMRPEDEGFERNATRTAYGRYEDGGRRTECAKAMQRDEDGLEAQGDEDEDGEGQGGIDNYTGVSIKVCGMDDVPEW